MKKKELEQLILKLVPCKMPALAGGKLTCYATTPAPIIFFFHLFEKLS